jgi:hypothetical protein
MFGKALILKAVMMLLVLASCNNGMSSSGGNDGSRNTRRDRSQRTVIDSAEYIDFTGKK